MNVTSFYLLIERIYEMALKLLHCGIIIATESRHLYCSPYIYQHLSSPLVFIVNLIHSNCSYFVVFAML